MTDTVWWNLFAVIGMVATFASITVAIFCWKLPEHTLPGEDHDLPASEVVARHTGNVRVVPQPRPGHTLDRMCRACGGDHTPASAS